MSLFFGKTAEGEMNEMVDEKMGNGMDRPVDDMGTARDEHYDGSSMDDVFENYDDARKGNLYVPIHFVETRKYLQQVRDLKRAIEARETSSGRRPRGSSMSTGMRTEWCPRPLLSSTTR